MPIATKTTGHFNVSALAAPTAPYTLGSQAGVPTGTTLTTRTSLGSPTATGESYILTNPVTAATNTRSYNVYRDLRFTNTITPAAGSPSTPIRFDRCRFEGQGNWTVEVDATGRSSDIMTPLVVFTNCEFYGADNTAKGLLGGTCWVIDCDMRNSEDGWSGWFFNVGIRSNFAGYGVTEAEHSDGAQCTDTGHSLFSRCWFSTAGPGASQAFRIGTEAGAVTDVGVYYCGFDGGGYSVQSRGDSGAGDIDTVTFIGNRWTTNNSFGPVDFEQTTLITWSDNAYFDGTPIAQP